MRNPARAMPLAFLVVMAIGTVLLAMPFAAQDGRPTPLIDAAFTAVSATSVTGLITLDTATHWSRAGQVIILVLIQVGGFGVMALATLLSVAVTGRLRLQASLAAQTESHSQHLADVRRIPLRVALAVISVEAVVALMLTLRFRATYDSTWSEAIWQGVFHAISAFNNAGFGLATDNLVSFVGDPLIIVPLCLAVIIGGLGFPVLAELRRRLRRPRDWSVHLRVTLAGTGILLVAGVASFALLEWSNPETLEPLDLPTKVLASITGGVMPRTAGFNSVDVTALNPETYPVQNVLMFIGGGSAGTAGGIKITTFFLLAFMIWSEIRGETETVVGHRRIASATQRQAMTISLLALGVVAVGTLVIMVTTDHGLNAVLFETVSAFATVGLSAGITPTVGVPGKITLMVLMFVGRVGTITVGSALALKTVHRLYRLPEERPIVG
ncbi:MAG: TrkH family potassium uptake protein [Propionibacteriales bacterium]|nr:TrkH family potassium uptake protein [Propionibacteriales bacterium]